jgi:hypothetical protein
MCRPLLRQTPTLSWLRLPVRFASWACGLSKQRRSSLPPVWSTFHTYVTNVARGQRGRSSALRPPPRPVISSRRGGESSARHLDPFFAALRVPASCSRSFALKGGRRQHYDYSSSSAGMRPARNSTTGCSSKSPSSASPVRDQAITPTLVCARRSAARRAACSDLHATAGSVRRRVPRPARNDCTM